MGLLTRCSVPRGGFLYTMIVPGEGFCSIQVVSGGMVLDEIDTCIRAKPLLQLLDRTKFVIEVAINTPFLLCMRSKRKK